MQECGNVQVELDLQYRDKQPAALRARPRSIHIAGLRTEHAGPLQLNDGSVRPLDDLVAKYGQHLQPNQLIRIDGKVMAIAMMINVQHLMYREDLLKQANVEPPKTYDDMLKAAEAIRKAGLAQYPIGGTYKTGWTLGDRVREPVPRLRRTVHRRGQQAAVNGEAGRKTLEMMKALTGYMDPEYLVSDATFVQKQFQQGKIALSKPLVIPRRSDGQCGGIERRRQGRDGGGAPPLSPGQAATTPSSGTVSRSPGTSAKPRPRPPSAWRWRGSTKRW